MARHYDKEKARAGHLKRKFGITLAQYDELLEQQGGRCAICSKSPDKEGQSLAVDHDHNSGEIRGLLCRYCNHRIIGRHRDADLLRRMAEYVERHTGWFVPPTKKRRKPKYKAPPRRNANG